MSLSQLRRMVYWTKCPVDFSRPWEPLTMGCLHFQITVEVQSVNVLLACIVVSSLPIK